MDRPSRELSDNASNTQRNTERGDGDDGRNADTLDATEHDADATELDETRTAATLANPTPPDATPTRETGDDAVRRLGFDGRNNHPRYATGLDATLLDATGRDAKLLDTTGLGLPAEIDIRLGTASTPRNTRTLLTTRRNELNGLGDATDATDATLLEMNRAALIPVEPTPAVRTQLELTICLSDWVEIVDVEMVLKTRSLFCRTGSPGLEFGLCSCEQGRINRSGVAEMCRVDLKKRTFR